MPPIPRCAPYAPHNKTLLKAAKDVCQETMSDAAKEIHELKDTPEGEVADCGILCDGTCQRQGYSSLNGCVTAISMDTGKVVDVEVLCRFFAKPVRSMRKDDDTPQNNAWKIYHKTKCKVNFDGSGPAIEPEGAVRIFQCSVPEKLRYTEYFGDGDSKSHGVVHYFYNNGDDVVKVAKKESVGHVQKQVGTALQKYHNGNKGMGGNEKLTDKMIDKLHNYYGVAIRSNPGNLEAMRKAILASLFHCTSSDYNKCQTASCPAGKDSWCGFMPDKATGREE